MRLTEDVGDGGNISDPKRDGVKVVGIVGERLRGQCLGVCLNKSDLWRYVRDP